MTDLSCFELWAPAIGADIYTSDFPLGPQSAGIAMGTDERGDVVHGQQPGEVGWTERDTETGEIVRYGLADGTVLFDLDEPANVGTRMGWSR